MDSRRGLYAALAAVALALVAWAFLAWWRSDERRIRSKVSQIQEQVEKTSGESNLVALDKARRITGLFAPEFEFRARQFDFQTSERSALAAGIHRYRSLSDRIAMKISGDELHVDPVARRASQFFTAEFVTGFRGSLGREAYAFQVNWVERDGDWRIDYVDLLEVLEPSTRWGL